VLSLSQLLNKSADWDAVTQLERAASSLAAAETLARAACTETLRRLDVELETGGNVRFIDGMFLVFFL
jgi:hypothetical protein